MDFHFSRLNPPGTLIAERYRVGELLGQGAMGAVYAGVDERLDRPVALKFLRQNAQETPHALERFEREARSAARLRHPNIVNVSDFLKNEGRPCLVMERLEGQTLQHTLLERTLDNEEAVEIQLQVLSALGAAHDAGVLHRDIKPANIFLIQLETGSVLVKLLDFGLARLLEEKKGKKLTATGITLGTPAYMAPERLMGAGIDLRSDLYSVGVCLYESIYGQLPGARSREEGEKTRKPEAKATQHTGLDSVIDRACAHQPEQRFASAAEMATALRRAANGAMKQPGKKGEASKRARWRSPAALRTAAAATALVVQVTASVIWLGSGKSEHSPSTVSPSTHSQRSSEPRADTTAQDNNRLDGNEVNQVAVREREQGDPVVPEPAATPSAATPLPPEPSVAPIRAVISPATMRRVRTQHTGSRMQTQLTPSVPMTVLADRPIVPDWGRLERDRNAAEREE